MKTRVNQTDKYQYVEHVKTVPVVGAVFSTDHYKQMIHSPFLLDPTRRMIFFCIKDCRSLFIVASEQPTLSAIFALVKPGFSLSNARIAFSLSVSPCIFIGSLS